MRKFDTKIQYLKYMALKEVAKAAWNDELLDRISDIPKQIAGPKATMRCCIYKERAILAERVKLAVGGDKANPNIIEVIAPACDECPMGGYDVTNACRGCIAHRCKEACKVGAISFDENQKCHIDKSKCVECGACARACQYSAIVNHRRPCEVSCKIGAISMSETKAAAIDNEKCTACGACVYQCPFGAISDKSFILNIIDLIKRSENGKNFPLYAIVAPSIAAQFTYARGGQVISAIRQLGFTHVTEVATGADSTALHEASELVEKGFLTSSCCPAFVSYVKTAFPDMADKISSTPSPMVMTAMRIREQSPDAKIVFIGPCTAKKAEARLDEVRPFIDSVLTFEELQALFDSRDIELTVLNDEELDEASRYGRIFARSGGLTEAVAKALDELGADFEVKSAVCSGFDECKVALLKASKGVLKENFIEGMACAGGCVGGAGCLTHGTGGKALVDRHGDAASRHAISDEVACSVQ